MNNVTNQILSEKLHEFLLQEIDFEDSETNKLIEKISLNLILTNLTFQKRTAFYSLIAKDNYDEAILFVKKEISDFEKKVAEKVKENFKKVL
jgi:hypothetical protein